MVLESLECSNQLFAVSRLQLLPDSLVKCHFLETKRAEFFVSVNPSGFGQVLLDLGISARPEDDKVSNEELKFV